MEGASTKQTLDILGTTIIVAGDLVLTEVLRGFKNDKGFKIAKSLLEKLVLVSFTNLQCKFSILVSFTDADLIAKFSFAMKISKGYTRISRTYFRCPM